MVKVISAVLNAAVVAAAGAEAPGADDAGVPGLAPVPQAARATAAISAAPAARLASQLCRHRQDAEGVTHSALLKAAQHVDGFRWEASMRTWLHRIATNECQMLRRQKVPASLNQLLEDAATAPGEPLQMPAAGPAPEDAAVEAETRRRVVAALAGLPDRYRTAVLVKDGLALSAEGVAAAMGMSVPAVRSVLHRARSALRESLSAPQSR